MTVNELGYVELDRVILVLEIYKVGMASEVGLRRGGEHWIEGRTEGETLDQDALRIVQHETAGQRRLQLRCRERDQVVKLKAVSNCISYDCEKLMRNLPFQKVRKRSETFRNTYQGSTTDHENSQTFRVKPSDEDWGEKRFHALHSMKSV